MRFRLTYEGRLKGQKRDVRHVHEIRKYFHLQLASLWRQEPLVSHNQHLYNQDNLAFLVEPELHSVVEQSYHPLISSQRFLVAELRILFLRPSPPRTLFGDGGDIDNRIKTLVDALRKPTEGEQRKISEVSDNPIYCLLEDDKLVTHLSVETDRLLKPAQEQQHCQIVLTVDVKGSRVTMDNLDLIA